MTFQERLYGYYAENHIGENKYSFLGFALILKILNFSCSSQFAYKICGLSPPKYRKHHYEILTDNVLFESLHKYVRKLKGVPLFFMFLDLDVRISRITVAKSEDFLSSKQFRDFSKLCKVYFELLKKKQLSKVLNSEYRDLFFIQALNIECKKEEKLIQLENQEAFRNEFYRNIGDFSAKYSDTASIWGNEIPYIIQNIPMGGKNKKY